jgi:hypothetical protein
MSNQQANDPAKPDKKFYMQHLPGILTGSAALLAALTTVFVNVRGDKNPPETPAPAVATAQPAIKPTQMVPDNSLLQPKEVVMQIRLDRMRVDNDGSIGTTDWTFDMQVDGRSMFSIPFQALTDQPGSNLVQPQDPAMAQSLVNLAGSASKELKISGWKSRQGAGVSPDVQGAATFSEKDKSISVELKPTSGDSGAFVMYFSLEQKAS